MPSFALQSNFDRILKVYFDKFRAKGLPPELEGKVQGKLFQDQRLLDQWRNTFRPALKYQHPKFKNFVLAGAIDDCLFDGKFYIPIDFKTTGASAFEESSEKYYQHQLDIYNLLLESQGFQTKGLAYLVYYKPQEVTGKGVMEFKIVVKEMKTNQARAKKLFEDAIELLKGPTPKSHSECKFCSWGNDFLNFE